MAQRRMTSLEVIDTDAFLDMPISSQLLYFHLNARADDDGFVASPRKIMRSLGGTGDDLKVLISKKFLIAFEDGVCVIKHWRVNNFIRKDLYKETKYLDHKQTLFIRATGAYTLTDDDRAIPLPNGHFQMDVVNAKLTTRQLRIGKVREDSPAQPDEVVVVSEEENPKPVKKKKVTPEIQSVFDLFTDNPARFQWRLYESEREAAAILHREFGIDLLRDRYSYILKHRNDKGAPQIYTPSQFLEKMPKMEYFAKNYA